MSMRKVLCPACRQFVEHDRGYLPTHTTDLVRGNLATGTKVCEASNRKIITELETIVYSHTCSDCGLDTEIKLTEDYPGAFEMHKPFIEMDCIGCSVNHDGYYCENEGCGLEVKWHDDEWQIADPGQQDTKVVYSQADADAHVAAWHAGNAAGGQDEPDDIIRSLLEETHTAQQATQSLQAVAPFALGRLLDPSSEPTVLYHEAGWYEVHPPRKGVIIPRHLCHSDDPTSSGRHQGVFKAEFHRTVLVSDGHIIYEEPDGSRETQEV